MKNCIEKYTIGAYILLFTVAIVGIQQVWYSNLFSISNFLHWDAEFYNQINIKGYSGNQFAFFPLFPLIWRVLNVDTILISLINSVIFFTSFYLLIRKLNIKCVEEIALYLTLPSAMFFFLPYSEAVFYMTSVMLLIGLKYHKNYWVYIGLFLSILSRPAFTVFIPAIIITEFLSKKRGRKWMRMSIYLFITIIGVCLVAWIQFLDTGEWFRFFSVQKDWGNELQVPKLPLTTFSDSGYNLRADGYALFVGVISGLYIIASIFKLFKLKAPAKEVTFSLLYLSGISLLVLLYRGGQLFSLNRFVFATPFVVVALNHWFSSDFYLKPKQIAYLFISALSFWAFFISELSFKELAKCVFYSSFLLLFFISKMNNPLFKRICFVAIIAICFITQIIFYLKFMNGDWVA